MKRLSTLLLFTSTISLSVSGCVSYDTQLTNPLTHQSIACMQNGFGWLGAPVAAHMHSKCVDAAQSHGFQITKE